MGERVAQLLQKIRAANPGKRLLIVLDNAPYNHAGPVVEAARRLRIELFYLPPYSPNLNLIERFWKFLKRKVARNRYYTTFAEFRSAVQNVLNDIAAYRGELSSLMTERFQPGCRASAGASGWLFRIEHLLCYGQAGEIAHLLAQAGWNDLADPERVWQTFLLEDSLHDRLED